MNMKLSFDSNDLKKSRFDLQKKSILKYFHKVNKPVLIGHVALELRVSLEEAENLMEEMCYEENAEIRRASESELENSSYIVAYVLTKPASMKMAHDP